MKTAVFWSLENADAATISGEFEHFTCNENEQFGSAVQFGSVQIAYLLSSQMRQSIFAGARTGCGLVPFGNYGDAPAAQCV